MSGSRIQVFILVSSGAALVVYLLLHLQHFNLAFRWLLHNQ